MANIFKAIKKTPKAIVNQPKIKKRKRPINQESYDSLGDTFGLQDPLAEALGYKVKKKKDKDNKKVRTVKKGQVVKIRGRKYRFE